MKTHVYPKCLLLFLSFLLLTTTLSAQQAITITGPVDPVTLLPATLGNGVTPGKVYTTQKGMLNYVWVVSPAGSITAGQGTNSITVTWTNPTGQQTVSVSYTNVQGLVVSAVLIINYYPFSAPINALTIPQFVDPLPHFAAGLRVNARAGGSLIVRAKPVQQVALSTGTVLATGTIGPTAPNVGKGNYAAYAISKDNGATFGPAMWPAQTIEAEVGKELLVTYENALTGFTYNDFNILADQTLMGGGFTLNGNPLTDPYTGDIPMVVHLHGGEMPSGSDGGPTAWFTPGYLLKGPGFKFGASSLSTYPNQQESGTLWYHPHDQGLTRINVYTGLAGFYFLRGPDEEAARLPGWSGDDKVMEIQPAGKQPPFNGSNTYLPEIEVGIQDRMFNTKGELYWPVAPTNPAIHPFWTPEFFGNVMVVNGKSWPYLSVTPRKYRFRMLDGCNARFLNMWLQDLVTKTVAPSIIVVGSDGAFLDIPVVLNPAKNQALLMAPGERYDVIIDFTGVPAGTTFTLMNNANAPYPGGLPVVPGLTDRIMQFVVNGKMVDAAAPASPGIDKSMVPANVRPVNPMVKLTNFAGLLTAGVKPAVKRQIVLNEVASMAGPVQVLFNNSHFDGSNPIPGAPPEFGGPTETPTEGTTELVSVINTTIDAHPIHIHLTQWQLVSRQAFNSKSYLTGYAAAWALHVPLLPAFPVGLGYPGGSGSPMPYTTVNADGAVGGNPAITPYLTGAVIPADPQERVWKDDIRAMPGEVSTYIVRYAPTDQPVNAAPDKLMYGFDPSYGPGYVWHCHIIDHEDMDMMRPLMVQPSSGRSVLRITAHPVPAIACAGDRVTFSVKAVAPGPNPTYQWQVSTDAGTTWTILADGAPYSGSITSSLSISPTTLPLSANLYQCIVKHPSSVTSLTSNPVVLTVNNCSVSGTLIYNNPLINTPLTGFTVAANGQSAITDAFGVFTINSVTSGTHPVTISLPTLTEGGINSTDAGSLNSWIAAPVAIPNVKLLAGDVDNNLLINVTDAQNIQNSFVKATPIVNPWVFGNATPGTVIPAPLTVKVNGASVTGFNILSMSRGDFNGSFNPSALLSNVTLNNSGLILTVPAGKSFDLPVKAVANMTVGAISLILNVPANMVTVTNVSIAGSAVPVTWNVNGDVLRIGWNSTAPAKVGAGNPLVVITLMPAPFIAPQPVQITLIQDALNEVADGLFNPVVNSQLTVDNVSITASAAVLQVSAFPNPATTSTTITYLLPVAGTVNLGILNIMGMQVKSIIVNQNQSNGSYTITNYSLAGLIKGTYTIRLTLQPTVGILQTATLKLMIQ